MVGELSSPFGIRDGVERFRHVNEMIFQDIENLMTVPDNWGDIAEKGVERMKAEMPDHVGHSTEEIANFRDRVLVELLKLHKKI
jgi:carnitine 3-dehydrogenase